MKNVTEEKADNALHYLLSTVDEYAQATADSKHLYNALKETLPDLLRETEASGFVDAHGSNEVRKAQARSSEDYKEIVRKRAEILEQYRQAEYDRQRLEAKREAARLTLSMFQSMLRHQNTDGM